jgi:hypothetical protein
MEFYSICTACKDHNTLMRCSIFMLRRSMNLATFPQVPEPMSLFLSSLDVMFPRLLNKAAVVSRRRGRDGRPAS